MPREQFTNPFAYLDEQILRQYTKLAIKVEARKNLRVLTIPLNLTALFTLCLMPGYYPFTVYFTSVGFLKDILGTVIDKDEQEEVMTYDAAMVITDKIEKYARLPTFIIGSGLMMRSGINFYHQWQGKQSEESPQESWNSFTYGLSLFCISSSIYLRSKDPNVLKKQPAWRTTYEWLKEKANSLQPAPLPEPLRMRMQKTTIENYL